MHSANLVHSLTGPVTCQGGHDRRECGVGPWSKRNRIAALHVKGPTSTIQQESIRLGLHSLKSHRLNPRLPSFKKATRGSTTPKNVPCLARWRHSVRKTACTDPCLHFPGWCTRSPSGRTCAVSSICVLKCVLEAPGASSGFCRNPELSDALVFAQDQTSSIPVFQAHATPRS